MDDDNKELVCDDCGTEENVEETFCPYAEEIRNKEIPANLCRPCYRERCRDI